VRIVLKCGSLNLLEPSGPVQACNGIALPFFSNINGIDSVWTNMFKTEILVGVGRPEAEIEDRGGGGIT
jgi:hypothetical protein